MEEICVAEDMNDIDNLLQIVKSHRCFDEVQQLELRDGRAENQLFEEIINRIKKRKKPVKYFAANFLISHQFN